MTKRIAARLACLAILLPAAPASAQDGRIQRVRALDAARAATCDRAGVGACQSEARRTLDLCTPFKGRRACAGYALSELDACWAATGCF